MKVDELGRLRDTGETTRQMKAAPEGAVYIWCNTHLHYPLQLARYLGREDLRIFPPSLLSNGSDVARRTVGGVVTIVVDHGAQLTEFQRAVLRVIPA